MFFVLNVIDFDTSTIIASTNYIAAKYFTHYTFKNSCGSSSSSSSSSLVVVVVVVVV